MGFAREGARVAIADVRLAQARETAEAIEAGGGQALALEVDVARLPDLDRMIAGTIERFADLPGWSRSPSYAEVDAGDGTGPLR